MKKSVIIFYLSIIVGLLSSCQKFSYYQQNPNEPTKASPNLLLTNIEQQAFAAVDLEAAVTCRYMIYNQSVDLNQYYGWQRASFNGYDNLRQVVKMEEEAKRVNNPNYTALGLFFRSYYIIKLTETFGDVPYSDALKGDNGIFTPTYDTQEDIYLKVLNDLKSANNMLSVANGPINGDVVYNGDIQKWKKAINSLTLRVLMSLSLKTTNSKLDVINRFKEIVANPAQYPIFTSNADNAALTYHDLAGNYYPYYNDNSMKTDWYMDSSFVHILKNLKDPRLFVYADKMPSASNLPDNDFDAYGGGIGSAPLANNVQMMVDGKLSPINHRYYNDPVNEPSIAIGYPEVEFILAEAVQRGWISGDANTYYKNGIRASLDFSNYQNTYSSSTIDTYVNEPAVQLQSGQELEQILTQKYIAMFMNSGWQPFYNQRRTGTPVFETSGAGILNDGKIPKRWMYPESEYNQNQTNVEAAVSRQFPEGDNINGVMWLLK